MVKSTLKQEARRLVEQLSDDATWEDLIEQICVRQTIEQGLKDSPEGRTLSVEQVRKHFGLST